MLCNTLNWGNWNSGFVKLDVRWAKRDMSVVQDMVSPNPNSEILRIFFKRYKRPVFKLLKKKSKHCRFLVPGNIQTILSEIWHHFWLKMMVKNGLEKIPRWPSEIPANLPGQFSLSRQIFLHLAAPTLKAIVEFYNNFF